MSEQINAQETNDRLFNQLQFKSILVEYYNKLRNHYQINEQVLKQELNSHLIKYINGIDLQKIDLPASLDGSTMLDTRKSVNIELTCFSRPKIISHKKVKSSNEDSYYPTPIFKNPSKEIIAVFDGVSSEMGEASHLANILTDIFAKNIDFEGFVSMVEKNTKITASTDSDRLKLGREYLNCLISFIQTKFKQFDDLDNSGNILCTTGLWVLIVGKNKVMASLGDSVAISGLERIKDPRRKQRGIRYSNRTVCFRI